MPVGYEWGEIQWQALKGARAAIEHHLAAHDGRRRCSCSFIHNLKSWTSALQNHTRFSWHKYSKKRGVFFSWVKAFIWPYCLLLSDYNQDTTKNSRLLFLILFSLPSNSPAPLTCYHNALTRKSSCGNSRPFCVVKDRTISGLPFIPSATAQGKHNLLQADSGMLTLSGTGTCSSLTRNNHTLH